MKKVTIYYTSTLGSITATEGRLKGLSYRDVVYVPKRSRRDRSIMTYYSPFIMVVPGWNHPKPPSAWRPMEAGSRPGVTIQRGKYRSADRRWVSDFMKAVGQKLKPIVVFRDGQIVKNELGLPTTTVFPSHNPRRRRNARDAEGRTIFSRYPAKGGRYYGKRSTDSKVVSIGAAEAERWASGGRAPDIGWHDPKKYLLIWWVPPEYVKVGRGEAKWRAEHGHVRPIWSWDRGRLVQKGEDVVFGKPGKLPPARIRNGNRGRRR